MIRNTIGELTSWITLERKRHSDVIAGKSSRMIRKGGGTFATAASASAELPQEIFNASTKRLTRKNTNARSEARHSRDWRPGKASCWENFSCTNCQATFATKRNLTQHVKKSHWAKIRWLSLFFHKVWIHTKNTLNHFYYLFIIDRKGGGYTIFF